MIISLLASQNRLVDISAITDIRRLDDREVSMLGMNGSIGARVQGLVIAIAIAQQ